MKHLRLLLLFFMTALFGGNAMAEGETAKVLWLGDETEGAKALVFVYDTNNYFGTDQTGTTDGLTTYTINSTAYTITSVFANGTLLSDHYSANTNPKLPWFDIRKNVKKVLIESAFSNARPTSTAYWFYGMNALTSFEGIENLNTSSVEYMEYMFSNFMCESLTSLDLTSFNTANVKNMSKMFQSCTTLTTLNLTSFNTANVTNMNGMFSGCSSITSLDLTSFNTANVTNMKEMFKNLTSLTTIYTDEDAAWNPTDDSQMFYGSRSLVGKCGTKPQNYSSSYTNKTYARVCTPTQKGYFTAKTTVKLNASGYATYASTIPVEFKTTDNYTAWKITAIDGENITFEQITGAVPAGTGVLLMGDANGSAEINFYGTTPSALSDNLLEGVTIAEEISADTYYGLSGNEFVKVSTGTVPAHKALLPASAVNGSVKSLNLVFNDETGIREVRTVSSEQAAEIFNLAGQRLQKAQKGVNIVNGKKVLVK